MCQVRLSGGVLEAVLPTGLRYLLGLGRHEVRAGGETAHAVRMCRDECGDRRGVIEVRADGERRPHPAEQSEVRGCPVTVSALVNRRPIVWPDEEFAGLHGRDGGEFDAVTQHPGVGERRRPAVVPVTGGEREPGGAERCRLAVQHPPDVLDGLLVVGRFPQGLVEPVRPGLRDEGVRRGGGLPVEPEGLAGCAAAARVQVPEPGVRKDERVLVRRGARGGGESHGSEPQFVSRVRSRSSSDAAMGSRVPSGTPPSCGARGRSVGRLLRYTPERVCGPSS